MPSSENRVIVACAGSGKTTRLVRESLADPSRRVALVTYTNSNAREIASKFHHLNSGVPSHVDVTTWFGFLLRECSRPYQRSKYAEKRIGSMAFVNSRSMKGVPESDTSRYYFASPGQIFSDKIAQFVTECEAASSGAVLARLEGIYTDIFIDEFQDLAGWDLEVMRLFLESSIRVTLVGDPRQFIYATNPSAKNRQYRGTRIVDLVEKWEKAALCAVESMKETHRCGKAVCAFTNGLWPGMDTMEPAQDQDESHEHVGVLVVAKSHVMDYVARFEPQVLRHDKRTKTAGCSARNFGQAKGLEFDRVLIFPTGPITEYLRSGDLKCVEKAKNRLHVAVTRARRSVAFVFDGESAFVPDRWEPASGSDFHS